MGGGVSGAAVGTHVAQHGLLRAPRTWERCGLGSTAPKVPRRMGSAGASFLSFT